MSEEEATGVVTEAAAQESGHSESPETPKSNDQDKKLACDERADG